MCHRTEKYTVCRGVRASVSSEILPTGAIKGLKPNQNTSIVLGRRALRFWHHSANLLAWLGQRLRPCAAIMADWALNTDYLHVFDRGRESRFLDLSSRKK